MQVLGNLTRDRGNNLNLMRFLAATLVMFSHSYAISSGDPQTEPLRKLLGMSIGSVAVDIFFICSGFLLAGSLARKKDLFGFVLARVLRIYPGLIVSVFLTVLMLGVVVSDSPLGSFLGMPETISYLLKNSILVSGLVLYLPGVFDQNPFAGIVNMSLWTLPFEIRMYAALAALWVMCSVFGGRRDGLFRWLVVIVGWTLIVIELSRQVDGRAGQMIHFGAMFFVGSAFNMLKDRIPLSKGTGLLAVVILIASGVDNDAFLSVYTLLIAYVAMWLAFIPSGWIRGFNRAGDYSYGIYIYAYPVQQAVAHLVPGVSPGGVFLYSFPVTLALAMLSWHCIEKWAARVKAPASLSVFGRQSASPA